MYAGRIYMVEIDETVVCKFLYIMNFSHIIENLLSCTNLPCNIILCVLRCE